MPSAFKCIGLFGKYKDLSVREALVGLTEYLRYRDIEVLVGETTADEISNVSGRRVSNEEVGEHIDLGIVIGGDGTMLHVARALALHAVPVVGVNMGRLGFLTDIAMADMYEDIGRILDGEYSTEERIMLHVEVKRDNQVLDSHMALNDMVIGKSELERLIEIRTFVDGEFVTSARSDGVIIATPTGSTAYALSAGGPILTPQLRAIIMVPICPHTLSNRPIALQDTSVIDLTLVDVCGHCAHVSVDGQIKYHLDGDE
ncbi:MAG: NAD(+)/NADH kinase, partial [Gammaproteobacteria bacterium]|nr:NAD(+)/NADH kinase [Gammaproteobacteria bacterium]